MSEVFPRLAGVIGSVFDIDPEGVTAEMTAEDVDAWDSLNHLRLITEVESQFDVRLSMAQIMELENVGDLARAVEQLVAER